MWRCVASMGWGWWPYDMMLSQFLLDEDSDNLQHWKVPAARLWSFYVCRWGDDDRVWRRWDDDDDFDHFPSGANRCVCIVDILFLIDRSIWWTIPLL